MPHGSIDLRKIVKDSAKEVDYGGVKKVLEENARRARPEGVKPLKPRGFPRKATGVSMTFTPPPARPKPARPPNPNAPKPGAGGDDFSRWKKNRDRKAPPTFTSL